MYFSSLNFENGKPRDFAELFEPFGETAAGFGIIVSGLWEIGTES
jgi:hypothetical protein